MLKLKGPRIKCTENGLMIKNSKKFFSCTPDRQNIKVLVKSIIEFLRKKNILLK